MRWRLGWLCAGLIVVAGAVVVGFGGPAGAQTEHRGTPIDVRIERDLRPGAIDDPLSVNLTVTITEHGSDTEPGKGAAPADRFDVFALATNRGGEKSIIYPCGQVRDNDPQATPGIYACTVIVDHGGSWSFDTVVNQVRVDRRQPAVVLGRASTGIEIQGGASARAGPRGPRGKPIEVVALSGHGAAAAAWFICVALLAGLAAPALRQRLSTAAVFNLENRLDLLVKVTWTATAVTVGSGTYLLLRQTAYKTPFSSSAIHGAFALPYGRPYFLVLATKLTLYAVMTAAAVPLVGEARRRLRYSHGGPPAAVPSRRAAPSQRASLWSDAPLTAGATTTVAAPPGPPRGHEAPGDAPSVPAGVGSERGRFSVVLGSVAVFGGTAVVLGCVTLLKYFHELVEAARVTQR